MIDELYMAYFEWYDEYAFIGIFSTQIKAWLACDHHFKKYTYKKVDVINNKIVETNKHGGRRTRYHIEKTKIDPVFTKNL